MDVLGHSKGANPKRRVPGVLGLSRDVSVGQVDPSANVPVVLQEVSRNFKDVLEV